MCTHSDYIPPFPPLPSSFFAPAPSILLSPFPSFLPVRRMLSPRKSEGLHQEAGSQVLAGMKRRLDAEMQLHEKASTSSSVANQIIARSLADPLPLQQQEQEQQKQQHSTVTRDLEFIPKCAGGVVGARLEHELTSAFDLVDDALHISSDDEFEFQLGLDKFSENLGSSLNRVLPS